MSPLEASYSPPSLPAHGCRVESLYGDPAHVPDACVIELGRPGDCMFARSAIVKERCHWWSKLS